MRSFVPIGAVGLALLFATPVSAQMCGGGQGTSASTGGMMCGSGATTGQSSEGAMGEQKPQAQGMGCPCCRNMAMMGGGRGGSMNMPGMNMPGHSMPGMEMPKPQ